ncbi:MAG: GIY-YIG nuclease family protein [Aestuariivirga sp.]
MLASRFEDAGAAMERWQEKHPAVYIMANRRRGTLYIGVTSDLYSRACAHKNKVYEGFTADYDVDILVWYEHHQTMPEAIWREKQMKAWKREWKIKTVEIMNPGWKDLTDSIDADATLVSSKRDASMRWHDGE